MSEQGYPVTVAVRRPDGRVEQVRVGTAFKSGEGFTLTLGEMSIGGTPDAAAPVARRSAPASSGGGGGGDGMVFPNYGRSKGAPIVGASMGDLEFYANGARRTLNDASKSRWHDKERQLLAAIEAEIARQQGGGAGGGGDAGYGGGGRGATAAAATAATTSLRRTTTTTSRSETPRPGEWPPRANGRPSRLVDFRTRVSSVLQARDSQ
ncbi:hypothetical protein [Corallococcus macrosporus]|uniref:Uncharacterized protein n=1 Tax=Corallococcus macrosporus DSM 14697 TaxID=1189310 RepID=A0A286NW60_9BACT|nr:hypothetical protein [Corallococcus macrosporus]ATB51405.1 hypothetical protein MYMAC_007068 [Corallococcus macrosporus DSM 14697]